MGDPRRSSLLSVLTCVNECYTPFNYGKAISALNAAVYKNGDVTVYQMPVIVVSQYYFSFPVYPLVTWVLSTGFLLRVVVAALSVRLSVVCSDGRPVWDTHGAPSPVLSDLRATVPVWGERQVTASSEELVCRESIRVSMCAPLLLKKVGGGIPQLFHWCLGSSLLWQ